MILLFFERSRHGFYPCILPFPACDSSVADMVFVLDGSGSIGAQNFVTMKDFVDAVVDAFDVQDNGVRIGVIQYSGDSQVCTLFIALCSLCAFEILHIIQCSTSWECLLFKSEQSCLAAFSLLWEWICAIYIPMTWKISSKSCNHFYIQIN